MRSGIKRNFASLRYILQNIRGVKNMSDSFNNIGPAKEHVISGQQARHLFEGAGFSFVRNIDAGEHHYGLIFKK